MATEPLVQLSQVLDLAESVIDGVRPEQMTSAHAVPVGDVQTLVGHLISDTERSNAAARVVCRSDWTAPVPEVGADWVKRGSCTGAVATAGDVATGWRPERRDRVSRIGRVPRSLWSNQQIAEFAGALLGLGHRDRRSGSSSRPMRARRLLLRPGPRCARNSGRRGQRQWRSGPRSRFDDAPAEDRLAAFCRPPPRARSRH